MTAAPVEAGAHDKAAACRNCGEALSVLPRAARFCPACGQPTALHPPTVLEFAHEFVAHYVALEGALWRTLAALLLTPGRLSREYFAGRRQRYIAPLRLYLSFSLLLFVTVAFTGSVQLGGATFETAAEPPASRGDSDVVVAMPEALATKGWIGQAMARIEAMPPAERSQRVRLGVGKYLPYLLILLVPVLALYKKLVYWRRGRRYAEHLVVAFHAQTVVFVFALVSALPLPEGAGPVLLGLLFVHGAVALRRVYGGRWLPTLLRETLIIGLYGLTMIAAVLLLVFGSMLV